MKKIILALTAVFALVACSKNDTPISLPPSKAVLVLPASNEACTEGTVISSTQSTVLFKWNVSENADSYVLTVKNLKSGAVTSHTTTATQLGVTLERNQPYSWSVESRSSASAEVNKSEVWKFYNAGAASLSYAPFPAEAVSPEYGKQVNSVNSKITLDWSAEDVDGDIQSYDVYLGTSTASLTLLQANVSASILNDVTVSGDTAYYWKVISKDAAGNTSDSGLFFFRVN
jgi:hypothetical protein